MTASRYRFEALGREHNKAAFACGVEALDEYLKRQASQDMRRNLAAVFVLQDFDSDRIAAYYTLSTSSIEPADLPDELLRQLPRYRAFPAVLIGRFAVDTQYQGQSLGELLLYDAFRRVVLQTRQVASMAIIVEAKDDRARSFYERYAFQRFRHDPFRLFIPVRTVARLIDK